MTLAGRAFSFDARRSALPLDRLSFAAVAYLLLPNLIFLLGWFRPEVAVPLAALGLWLAWRMGREMAGVAAEGPGRGAFLAIAVIVAAWATLGGAGHFFFANHDWRIRDLVLGDLTYGAWPVSYGTAGGEPLLLRSAIGFFLPAAVVGKLFGIAWVDWALYLWTVFGAVLFCVLLPLPRRAGLLLFVCLLMVVFYSGMDYLGILLVRDADPARFFPHAIEWWVPYSYSSLTAQLFWAPNHALPIWLLSALLYRHWAHADFWRLMLLVLPLSLIWTPFAVAGVLPFVLLAGLRWWRERQPLGLGRGEVVFALGLAYLSLRFVTLDLGGLPVHLPGAIAPGTNVSGFPLPTLTDYLVFVEMEFGILALALLPILRHSYGIYGVAVAVLLALPIVSLGPSKDTLLRLSVTPMLVLLMLLLGSLQDWVDEKAYPKSIYVIGIVLLLGAPTAYYEMARAVLWKRTPPNYGKSLVEYTKGHPPHYVARLNRPDLGLLLREPRLVPPAGERAR